MIVLGLAVAIVVAVAVAISVSLDDDDADAGTTDPAAWNLPALEGDGRVVLADFRGTPTVVNFFASWCTACDVELPDFRDAALALDGEVDFVFVNSNETGSWRPMAERNEILGFPLAKDVGGSRGNGLYRDLGGTGGMPITAFYDAQGRLVDRAFGALTGEALPEALEEIYGVTI